MGIDYEGLLLKYMRYVYREEGFCYVPYLSDGFTQEEVELLAKLAGAVDLNT